MTAPFAPHPLGVGASAFWPARRVSLERPAPSPRLPLLTSLSRTALISFRGIWKSFRFVWKSFRLMGASGGHYTALAPLQIPLAEHSVNG